MKFYRYIDTKMEDGVEIDVEQYYLIKETRCGYWIDRIATIKCPYPKYKKRWVSKTSIKRYAYLTKKQALVNFIARKRSQISFLKYYLENAKKALYLGEKQFEKEEG